MKIHFYDDDPRLLQEGLEKYSQNCGSFAQISNGINKELKKLDLYSEADKADIVGFASGLKLDFGFHHKRRFCIGVWETNEIPMYLLNTRANLERTSDGENYKQIYQYFGLSKQVANIWEGYGFRTPIVDIGCDTDFWCPQDIKKNDKFTILSTTSCNFRSGIQHTIQVFINLWNKDKDIKLIIKNTDERAAKLPYFVKRLRDKGMDIEYICQRQTLVEIRELMAKSHVLVYNPINTSAGLPILEASAMELPVIVGDYCPTNCYPSCETIKCYPLPISDIKEVVVDYWGLPFTFPQGWINESKAMMNWLDGKDFYEKLLKIKYNYDIYINRAKECRQEVTEKWTWANSTQQLLRNLNI